MMKACRPKAHSLIYESMHCPHAISEKQGRTETLKRAHAKGMGILTLGTLSFTYGLAGMFHAFLSSIWDTLPQPIRMSALLGRPFPVEAMKSHIESPHNPQLHGLGKLTDAPCHVFTFRLLWVPKQRSSPVGPKDLESVAERLAPCWGNKRQAHLDHLGNMLLKWEDCGQ